MNFTFGMHINAGFSSHRGRNYFKETEEILKGFGKTFQRTDSGFEVLEECKFGIKIKPDFSLALDGLMGLLSEEEIVCATIHVPIGIGERSSTPNRSANQNLSYQIDYGYEYTRFTFYLGIRLSREWKIISFNERANAFLNLVYLTDIVDKAEELLSDKHNPRAAIERLDKAVQILRLMASQF